MAISIRSVIDIAGVIAIALATTVHDSDIDIYGVSDIDSLIAVAISIFIAFAISMFMALAISIA